MSKTASTKLGAEIQDDGPTGQVNDPSYKTSRNEAIPVVDDEAQVEDPGGRENADSNKQLGTWLLLLLSRFWCSLSRARQK
ncbi:hypothetical protein QBC39DRAFT_350559 [Podospora conica]|nr:hypothetical protein QBC39DRAFT_350559 [Schizothecium conicum]